MQVWSLESGDCQLTLPGDHAAGVSCVTFNDQWVISGDNSGEIKVIASMTKWSKLCRTLRLTNGFHVAVCLFSNRSQMMSKFGKNKRGACKLLGKCFIGRWLFPLMKVEPTLKSFHSGKVSHLTPSMTPKKYHRLSLEVKVFISQAKASRLNYQHILSQMSITCNMQDQHYNEGSIFINVFMMKCKFFFSVWLQFSWSFFETCVSFYPLHILFLEPLHSAQPSSSHSLACDCRLSCLFTLQLKR